MIDQDESQSTPDKSVRIAGRRVNLRRAADRLPTKWLGSAIAVAFLVLTAAFGSFRAAPDTTITDIAVGETYTNAQVSVVVERLIVTDAVDGLMAPDGQKNVLLVMTVTDQWNRPLLSREHLVSLATVSTGPDAAEGELIGSDDVPSYSRTADGTSAEALQPDVPFHVAWTWTVDDATAQKITSGDDVVVTIFDQTLTTGTYASAVSSWGEPTPGARVVVQPETIQSVDLTDLAPEDGG